MRKWILRRFIAWFLSDVDTRIWFRDFLVQEFQSNAKLRQLLQDHGD